MKTLRERMRYAWQQSGKTVTQIAKDITAHTGGKISRAAVSLWMLEKPQRAVGPTNENLVGFAKSTRFNLPWLMTGEGPERQMDLEEDRAFYGHKLQVKSLTDCITVIEDYLPSAKYKFEPAERAKIIEGAYQVALKAKGDIGKVLEFVRPIKAAYDKRQEEAHGRKRKGSA